MTRTQNAMVAGSQAFGSRLLTKLAFAAMGAMPRCLSPRRTPRRTPSCARQVVGEQYIPLRIAIPDFDGSGPNGAEIARQIGEVIRADLGTSAPFKVLDKAGFIERDVDIAMQPIFGNWTVAGLETQALVDRQCRGQPDQQCDDRAVPPVGRVRPEDAVRGGL